MLLHKLSGRWAGGYTTFGSCWKKGEVRDLSFALLGGDGNSVPVQSEGMAWWPDGSLKWVSHTADSDRMGDSVTLLPVFPEQEKKGAAGNAGGENKGLSVKELPDGYEVNTGALSLWVPAGKALPANALARDICMSGRVAAEAVYPVFLLERRGCVGWSCGKYGDDRTDNGRRPGTGMNSEGEIAGGESCDRQADAGPVCGEQPVSGQGAAESGFTAGSVSEVREYRGEITEVTLEAAGPLQAVFCFHGRHVQGESTDMPFVIRMYLGSGSPEIRFEHTFLFDGAENRDYLKGMGIRFEALLEGRSYDRHVQFATDKAPFHEAAVMLMCSYPKLSPKVLRKQLAGEREEFAPDSTEAWAAEHMHVWDRYFAFQDSSGHFAIRKQTKPECCVLNCTHGRRAPGAMAVSGTKGGLLLGIRDFWQKYPSGLEVAGLAQERSLCTAWFYSPEAEAYDFRHYSTESYPKTCYEGFDEVGASAVGIGVSSGCSVRFTDGYSTDGQTLAFAQRLQKPPVYVGEPEYYHEAGAFGRWSLSTGATEPERWLEGQLDKAFAFYKGEVEARDWYGLFDYGDVMHTYDPVRHCWKYDVGGYAWQNTELVPTYWLWLYFLRSGREDVFSLAEAMSRHCSEVDVYHFGPYKGLGSRHNVRHWGCSCKEPRIAMAGHHRFLCYLTGDRRLGDIFEDVKDADRSMKNVAQCNDTDENGNVRTGVRSGPDWSSFVSNWMTWYERTLDETYRKKIETGIADIAATPFGFASGPDFYYDEEQAHLIYKGEVEDTPNQHLQICMGGPQVWFETADMLEDDTLNRMLADLGAFYYLSREEKIRLTDGKIRNRPFGCPMFAAVTSALSAMRSGDRKLAEFTWGMLLDYVFSNGGTEGFVPRMYAADGRWTEADGGTGDGSRTEPVGGTEGGNRIESGGGIEAGGRIADGAGTALWDIPWITTNTTSQWCLNVMMCLEFIREYLPADLEACREPADKLK